MTPEESTLLTFLHSGDIPLAARAFMKRTFHEFVLEYGWWYEPIETPPQIAFGTPKQCHKNAFDLTLADESLVYCEGYALFKGGSLATIHAWVTDGHGHAIDNTWPKHGVAYAGVPFTADFVTLTTLTNRATVSLIDDFQNDFPFSGDLGDRPDEWLELRGSGRRRLK